MPSFRPASSMAFEVLFPKAPITVPFCLNFGTLSKRLFTPLGVKKQITSYSVLVSISLTSLLAVRYMKAREKSQPLLFNQVQLSITHANLFAQGIAANMNGLDQSISRDVGLLDYSRLKGMILQAWSPFQKGFFDGVFLGDRENFADLNDAIDELAKAYGVTPTGIAVAWITRHPEKIQVVLGTTKPERVVEAAAGSSVSLTREEWYRLFRAAGHTLP